MEDTPLSFSCSDCQRHFPSLPELSRHRELLHPSLNQEREADSIYPLQCGRGYHNSGSLVSHHQTHKAGLFPCTTCGRDFPNPMALKNHMRSHAPEGQHRHRPSPLKETTPHLQSETLSTDSWSQRLGPGEAWENETKHVKETHECESRTNPRAAPSTWEDPPTKQRESLESQADPEENIEGWESVSSSARTPPFRTPASNLLSNLEQYLAESVVNFTGVQESTQPLPAEKERKYKCSQCGKTYKHAGSLTNHRQSHTLGVYPCAICFKEFSNLMALKNHSRLHAQYRPYHCPHCPRAFRLPRDLLEHQQSHEVDKQEQPPDEKEMLTTNGHTDEKSWDQLPKTQMLNGSGELSTSGELADSGLEEYRPFCCGDCGRTYRHAGSLINHRKSHQTGIYPCSICSKQLFNAAALKNHVRAHHRPRQGSVESGKSVPPTTLMLAETTYKEEEIPITTLDHSPYKCNECGRAYRHRGSLMNHLHSHRTGEYQCSVCPLKYPNLMALRNHVRVHCKTSRQSTDPGTEDSPCHFKRELLSDPVGTETALHLDQEHAYKHTEATTVTPTAGKTVSQVCRICGVVFEDPESLEHHSMTHRAREGENSKTETTVSLPRAFACRDCGKSYRHSGSLINHRQTHQTGDFTCGTCAKHFHTMAAMKSHLRRHSRRWNRQHRKQIGSAGGEARLPPVGTSTLKVENAEDLDSSQDPSGEGPCGTEDNTVPDENCLQAESGGNECGCERGETRFLGDSESRGTEEGLEKKEVCFLDNLDLPGAEESSETRFCNSLPGVDGDQTPAACQPKSSPQPGDTGSVWKAEVTHTCSDCGHSFPHATGLPSHRSCHPPGIYQCSLCPKEFDSLPALRSHFQNHRPGEVASAQPFLCCLCGMIFPGRAGYKLHLRQAHSASGMTEGSEEEGEEEGTTESASTHSPPLQLSEAELLNQLQREVEALDGARYGHICGCCGQTYDDLGSLERHHQSQSSSNTTEKAPSHLEGSGDTTEVVADHVIEGTVTSVSEEGGDIKSQEKVGGTVADSLCMQVGEGLLESHPRPFRCNQCGKTYRHGGSLVNHRKIHQTGDFICPVCARCYPNLAAYRNHLRNHPHCKGSEPQVGPILETGISEPQSVAEAGLEQAEVGQLQEKLKVEPLDGARVKEETWEETTVKEEEVEPKLETAEKGCQSEASTERPFSCEVCGRTYKHAGSLINHRQSHQTGHFGCQACSKGFSNLMSLKNHRRIHADPRRFCCGECGKAFRLRKQLANHQRVHTERHRAGSAQKLIQEDRRFRCGQCGQTYHHAGSLLNHRCSQEVGQYSCSSCPKTYSNRGALKDHQRLHSDSHRRAARSRRTAIRCALCGHGFPGQGSLERHLREHKETKPELGSGQGCPHGTEGSEGNLADKWGLKGTAGGTESVAHPEQEARKPGEHIESPSRTSGSEAAESLFWKAEKVDGWQGEGGPENHSGGWVPQGQVLTQPEDKMEDTVPSIPCHLADSQSNGPSLNYMNSWVGDSSSQLQLENHSYCCSHCGKTSCQPDGLLNPSIHKTDCHCCLLCSKECLNSVTSKSHNHKAAQSFACPNCSKSFQSYPEMNMHLQTHGSNHSQVPGQIEEAREPQDVEDMSLPDAGKAEEALSETPRDPGEKDKPASGGQGVSFTATEDKERPFCCAQCGRSYRHAGSLLNHQKAHTTGLYPCSLCPKLLPNLLSLKNHSRTHTDPKRYRCSICGKAFRTAARLQGHGRVHAPQEGPFTCPHCPRHFRHRISFLQHQQQHQEEGTVTSAGALTPPATSREDSSSPLPSTASLLDPSPQWPADLSFSL